MAENEAFSLKGSSIERKREKECPYDCKGCCIAAAAATVIAFVKISPIV